MVRWLRLTRPTSYSLYTYGREMSGRANVAVENMNLLPTPYIVVISRGEVRRIRDLTQITQLLSATAATNTSPLTRPNTMHGRWKGWGKRRSMSLS